MVEQPPLRHQLVGQEPEVAGQLGLADVLGQPDRAHRVKPGLGDLAVVEVPDLGELGQTAFLDRRLGPRCQTS